MANAQPLDDAALARLRDDLAAGKRPSLVLLSGGAGLAAGSRGQLVRIDDPPQDAEFLHVKVGGDELPFAPEELGLPGRRSKGAAAAAPPEVQNAPPPTPAKAARAPEPILEPVRPDRRTRAERVVTPPPSPAEPEVAAVDAATVERPAVETASEHAAGGRPRPKRAGRAGGAPPKVTLTLRFADFGWTVETLVAGRREKPQPVPLAAVRAFADQLEDQGLRRQLESTVEACRVEAQKRASTLRAELARLETELAALDD